MRDLYLGQTKENQKVLSTLFHQLVKRVVKQQHFKALPTNGSILSKNKSHIPITTKLTSKGLAI